MGSAVSRTILAVRGLGIHAGDRILVRDFDLDVRCGECVALLGRNGAGKSLTLHALAGLERAGAGTISLDGRALDGLPRRAIAQRIGLLLQDPESGHSETALETVLVGRHPHLAPWQWERDEDRRLARSMLTRVGLGDCGARRTGSLSGGEQRRVAMATLLAQQPAVYLLDEPTNHLDPHHQLAVLDLFREQTHGGHAVVATLHDPSLAARYADRAVLLFGDGRWLAGPVDEVLTPEHLSALYLVRIVVAEVEGRRVFVAA
ncbi:MAG: putative siderophore transport system ATP-binding protein YusV [Steroidobacteraceae bacterium]|nr:putative siderophore transport system ATP-binding protein YusV [Steroidobacteraceae bacterium]